MPVKGLFQAFIHGQGIYKNKSTYRTEEIFLNFGYEIERGKFKVYIHSFFLIFSH